MVGYCRKRRVFTRLFFWLNGHMTNIPTTEPNSVTAGDKVAWTKTLDDYPASSYTLVYILAGGGSKISITAAADGDDHLVSVLSSVTAEWTPGDYVWFSSVTDAEGERTTLDSGSITIKPDPTDYVASSDLRSHARKVLDAIEAVIEGRASRSDQQYTIEFNGNKRTLVSIPIADLLALRSQYLAEVLREEAAEKIAKGLDAGNRFLTRFR